MDFGETFPLRFWINLGRREDRRHEVEGELEKAGIVAERFAAVDAARKPAGDGLVLERPQPVRGYEAARRFTPHTANLHSTPTPTKSYRRGHA